MSIGYIKIVGKNCQTSQHSTRDKSKKIGILHLKFSKIESFRLEISQIIHNSNNNLLFFNFITRKQ